MVELTTKQKSELLANFIIIAEELKKIRLILEKYWEVTV